MKRETLKGQSGTSDSTENTKSPSWTLSTGERLSEDLDLSNSDSQGFPGSSVVKNVGDPRDKG